MGTADGRRHILRHIARNGNSSRGAVVADSHLIGRDLTVVDIHACDVAQREGLAHDGQRLTVGIGHLTRLRGGKLIGDAANRNVQRLGSGCYRQHKSRQEGVYLFHLTIIL